MADLDAIEVTRQLTKYREEIESLKHRMDNVETLAGEIHKLTTAIEVMTAKSDDTCKKVDEMSEKIEKLEAKPGKKAESLIDGAVATLINLILGGVFGAILALVIRS